MYAWRHSAWWHHRQPHSRATASWNQYWCSARAECVWSTGRGDIHLCCAFPPEPLYKDLFLKQFKQGPPLKLNEGHQGEHLFELQPCPVTIQVSCPLFSNREWVIFDTGTESHIKALVSPILRLFCISRWRFSANRTINSNESSRPKLLWMCKNAPLVGFVDTYSTR